MKNVITQLGLLSIVLLLVSGCSAKDIGLQSKSKAEPTKSVVIVTPTPPPHVLSTGFDSLAGNCPDAVTADTALIEYAASQNYNLDMQLRVKPTAGCDADPTSAAYKSFVRQVVQAKLLVNDFSGQLVYGYVANRQMIVSHLFSQLQAHYPSLSEVTITVVRGGRTYTVLTYSGHGQPQLNEVYGQ